MTLKTAIPELKRICHEVFGQELSNRNVRFILEILKIKNKIIKLQT